MESLPRRRVLYGPPFGATVWLFGYAVLPMARLYKPIWEYDARTLARDLGGHLAYGSALGVAMNALSDGA